jgi:hypothetical protein
LDGKDWEELFRKYNQTAFIDDADGEDSMHNSESVCTSMPKAQKTQELEAEPDAPGTRDNKYVHDKNEWDFEATISPKYNVLGEVKDVTTPKMHHVCVSVSFFLVTTSLTSLQQMVPRTTVSMC